MAKKVIISPEPSSPIITNVKDFGKHIKFNRTREGLTLADAAALCNINKSTLIRLEKGSEGIRLSTALLVGKMFGLKLVLE